MMTLTWLIISATVFFTVPENVGSMYSYSDSFTDSQKAGISLLRQLVKSDLTDEYMSEDYFLAKWLFEEDFNVRKALELLQENLKWRAQENISSVSQETWDDLHIAVPYSRNTFDINGRPVLYFDVNQWEIANLLYTSAPERFIRYFVKILEESEAHVRQLRAKGQDVTQFTLIVNMGGFSVTRHVCVQCLNAYRNIAMVLSKNFPYCTDKVVFINTPYIAKMAYQFLSTETQKVIKVYGQDRAQWKKMLEQYVKPGQFPVDLLDDKPIPQKDNSDGFMVWNEEL